MKIVMEFTALTVKAEELMRTHVNDPETLESAKSIRVLRERPLTVLLVPKVPGALRVSLRLMKKRPGVRETVLSTMIQEYWKRMAEEGLTRNDLRLTARIE